MTALPALLTAALSVALVADTAAGQCAVQGVVVGSYGTGCNPVFAGNVPTVTAALDAASCRLDVTVDAFGGCCNTYLVGRVLVLGSQPVSVPLPPPLFGAGCTLLAAPDVVLYQPSAVGSTFSLPLAAVLPPLTVYGQGAGLYFTTIGFTTDFALSAGAQIDLQ